MWCIHVHVYITIALTSMRLSSIVAVCAESSALSRVFSATAVKLTLVLAALVASVSLERGVVSVVPSLPESRGPPLGAATLHCRPGPGLAAGSPGLVGAGVASGASVGVALSVAVLRATGMEAGFLHAVGVAVGMAMGSAGRSGGRLLRTTATRMILTVGAMRAAGRDV